MQKGYMAAYPHHGMNSDWRLSNENIESGSQEKYD
jgi:hypothetical protein